MFIICDVQIWIVQIDGQIVGAGKPKDLLTEKFIKDLYEVDTKIEALPNDNINIRFLPKHFK